MTGGATTAPAAEGHNDAKEHRSTKQTTGRSHGRGEGAARLLEHTAVCGPGHNGSESHTQHTTTNDTLSARSV